MIIYKATNKINGNCYIGKTIQSLRNRKQNHKNDSFNRINRYNSYFHQAIRKYGFDNFEWTILVKTDSESKLNALEKLYIATYRKMSKLYNMTDGGEGASGCIPSKETRKKMSIASKKHIRNKEWGEKISKSRKGHIVSEETKEKLKQANLGKKHSEETKHKISKSLKGISCIKNNKKIKNKTTGIIFNSIKEASKYYNVNYSHIGCVCRGDRKKCGGYEWEYV
jgi:group I intron endonuclease